ncbi:MULTISPECIES: HAD family hydrolase [unclassified Clostridium]|uniref:HAD family hydrolase n=1 Tax=unclassified Clostridium TaxID=2614128 RepID=UPI000297EDD2|nr:MULTISPECIES: HAD family hydrolase [unclassified Clostridium]EKQ52235.1 MAG: haloacid dehalogenase superfamily enzyme, subfamily IA [Clostridium sp. Maddingley MBC34-26]
MKYLLWDFDNTLAYRDGMWSSTLYELLNEHGYNNLRMDDIGSYLESGFPWHSPEIAHKEFFKDKNWWEYMNEYFKGILKKLGVEDVVANKISSCIREKYINPSNWRIYDDTILCLKSAIEKGYSNIILSNHVPELEELMKSLGIRDYFIKVYSSAHVGYEKPNFKIYEKVLFDLNDAESITMIGDNYTADIQGAKRAGIEAILVRKDNEYNYERYFSTLKELADFI